MHGQKYQKMVYQLPIQALNIQMQGMTSLITHLCFWINRSELSTQQDIHGCTVFVVILDAYREFTQVLFNVCQVFLSTSSIDNQVNLIISHLNKKKEK